MGRKSGWERLLWRVPTDFSRRAVLAGGASWVAACGSGGKRGGVGGDSVVRDSADTGEAWPVEGTCGPGTPTAQGSADEATACPFRADPFGLGVASGDPLFDRVILWTRLVEEATDVAGSPSTPADVVWEIARDASFAEIVQTGVVVAVAEAAHSVHVDVDGLDADTVYWYRFRCGPYTSPVGRTKTMPCPDAQPEAFRLGFATCQNWLSGFYAAHRSMAAAEVDLVVFLGDYIYEGGNTGAVRDHGASEPVDLEGYRNRHGLYRADPDLQAAHASAPWMPIWDDHEVDNNLAGAPSDDATMAARRRAAYQAWYEHMPVRQAPGADGSLQIYRSVDVGRLMRLVLVDGRQYRDLQPCDDVIGPRCEEVDEERTLLGAEQEEWLTQMLDENEHDWVVLGNPVVMLPLDLNGAFLNPDQWDGYPLARQRFLDVVARSCAGRCVAFSGDIHAAGTGCVPEAPADYESTPAVAEFVVPPISSRVTIEQADVIGPLLATLPHIEWWDWTVNGWAEAVVTPDSVVTSFYLVDDVENPASEARVARVVRVTPGSLMPVRIDGGAGAR